MSPHSAVACRRARLFVSLLIAATLAIGLPMVALGDGLTLVGRRPNALMTVAQPDETRTPQWMIEAARRGSNPDMMGAAGAALVRSLDLAAAIDAHAK